MRFVKAKAPQMKCLMTFPVEPMDRIRTYKPVCIILKVLFNISWTIYHRHKYTCLGLRYLLLRCPVLKCLRLRYLQLKLFQMFPLHLLKSLKYHPRLQEMRSLCSIVSGIWHKELLLKNHRTSACRLLVTSGLRSMSYL